MSGPAVILVDDDWPIEKKFESFIETILLKKEIKNYQIDAAKIHYTPAAPS